MSFLSFHLYRKTDTHPRFFLPVAVLKKVFRGKFTEALRQAYKAGKLGFHGNLKPIGRPKVFASLIRQTYSKDWVVYSKRPFGGAGHVCKHHMITVDGGNRCG